VYFNESLGGAADEFVVLFERVFSPRAAFFCRYTSTNQQSPFTAAII